MAKLLGVVGRCCRVVGPGDRQPEEPPAAPKGFARLDLSEIDVVHGAYEL
jgi:hypothetical protein